MLITTCFNDSRNYICNGNVANIIYLENDLAKLAPLYRTILIVIDETRIADVKRRRIGKPLCKMLYTRMVRQGGLRLTGTIVTRIITRLKIVDTVIMIVAAVKSTAIIG